jgi:hypothetical protein
MTETSDDILKELRTQTAWLRLLSMPTLREELKRSMTSDKRRIVYELSTGDAGTREIAKAAGVGAATVSRYWTEWERVGLVRPSGFQGRVAHIASLASLGLGLSGEFAAANSREPDREDPGK